MDPNLGVKTSGNNNEPNKNQKRNGINNLLVFLIKKSKKPLYVLIKHPDKKKYSGILMDLIILPAGISIL